MSDESIDVGDWITMRLPSGNLWGSFQVEAIEPAADGIPPYCVWYKVARHGDGARGTATIAWRDAVKCSGANEVGFW